MPAGGAPVHRRPATLAVLVFAASAVGAGASPARTILFGVTAVERPRVEDLR
jgi:hypothetical protein